MLFASRGCTFALTFSPYNHCSSDEHLATYLCESAHVSLPGENPLLSLFCKWPLPSLYPAIPVHNFSVHSCPLDWKLLQGWAIFNLQCPTWALGQTSCLNAYGSQECYFILCCWQRVFKNTISLKVFFFLKLVSWLLVKSLDTFEPHCPYISGYNHTHLWTKIHALLPVSQMLF